MPAPVADQESVLSGTLRRPFTEQVAFFRGKLGNLVPTEFWNDLEREQHDTAFMVAGAQKADLLSDLAAAVDRTIAEGKSLDAFRGDFRAIVQRHGWHGWTGEGTKGGEAWRTRTIYRTNASTSYAAGRYAQLVAGEFPLWVYFHGGSKEPRQQHVDFDGICLPPDHKFWTIFYPPSDWGCSCYVVGARSERAARRLGGQLDKKLPEGWDRINPKTGTPFGAGRNWDYAPGASVAPIVAASAEKVLGWNYQIAKRFMESVPSAMQDALAISYRSLPSVAEDARRFARYVWGESATPRKLRDSRTLGLIGPAEAERLHAILRALPDLPEVPDLTLFDFSLAQHDLLHVQNSHGDDARERPRGQRAVTSDDFGWLTHVLLAPDTVRFAGISRKNEILVDYVKVIDGERFTITLAVRTGRRTLGLQTFFIGIRKGGSARSP